MKLKWVAYQNIQMPMIGCLITFVNVIVWSGRLKLRMFPNCAQRFRACRSVTAFEKLLFHLLNKLEMSTEVQNTDNSRNDGKPHVGSSKKLVKVVMKASSVEDAFATLKTLYPDVNMELVFGYEQKPPEQGRLF